MRRRIPTWLLAGAFTLTMVAGVGADDSPRGVVERLTDEVIAVLREEGSTSGHKRAEVEGIVLRYVDFETMSKLILARNWRIVGEAKQREFVEEFKKHLSTTYGENVDSYRDEVVTITGDREEARGDWTVKTQIVRGGPNDVFVDYRLRKQDAEWKIIDVVIERVSLVSTFRSQFQGVLSSKGIEGVLELLRDKNAKHASGLAS